MNWNIIISNDRCPEHWNDLVDRCRLTKDGKCSYEKCPLNDKEYDKMKALEKMYEVLSKNQIGNPW